MTQRPSDLVRDELPDVDPVDVPGDADPGGPLRGAQGRRRPRAGDQRRRPRPDLRPAPGRRQLRDHRHDADLGGLPADRRDRGPDPDRAPGSGLLVRDQLGLDAPVGAGDDHRRRTGTAARSRLQRLSPCSRLVCASWARDTCGPTSQRILAERGLQRRPATPLSRPSAWLEQLAARRRRGHTGRPATDHQRATEHAGRRKRLIEPRSGSTDRGSETAPLPPVLDQAGGPGRDRRLDIGFAVRAAVVLLDASSRPLHRRGSSPRHEVPRAGRGCSYVGLDVDVGRAMQHLHHRLPRACAIRSSSGMTLRSIRTPRRCCRRSVPRSEAVQCSSAQRTAVAHDRPDRAPRGPARPQAASRPAGEPEPSTLGGRAAASVPGSPGDLGRIGWSVASARREGWSAGHFSGSHHAERRAAVRWVNAGPPAAADSRPAGHRCSPRALARTGRGTVGSSRLCAVGPAPVCSHQ